ncbi:MAG: hypothetical protein AVDCRST_MAG96-4037 [uncultured Segetibacter sp.]|uniref:Uncharacterized protein n=1 Tax=uncultured Segetibacter sp. TaxID=481133 RepID=A0A6J4U0S4_9BACT|nr:MAG: hypothetical protein AVDCRST_MAG96-4037 [uncultured Segetibacter sp.]
MNTIKLEAIIFSSRHIVSVSAALICFKVKPDGLAPYYFQRLKIHS